MKGKGCSPAVQSMNRPLRAACLLMLAAALMVLPACHVVEEQPVPATVSPETEIAPALPVVPDEWIEVYFSGDRGNPEEAEAALVASIEGAQRSVDMAMFNFSLTSVRDALIGAHQRGVTVRVVTDSESLDKAAFRALQKAGIRVLGDRREGLMHDKYVIIDQAEVWTGSLNLTATGLQEDNNDIARLVSAELAEIYTADFEAMYVDDRFNDKSAVAYPAREADLNGVLVEVYFSPGGGAEARVQQLLRSAREHIDFLAYSFTSDPLAQALLGAAQDGVTVRGVMDADQIQSNTGGEFDTFVNAGLEVLPDGNPGLMHHKIIVIDRHTVIFGSYNFTRNANRANDENLVVVQDAHLAELFLQEVQRIYDQAAR